MKLIKKSKNWFTINVSGMPYNIEKKRVISEGLNEWISHLEKKTWFNLHMKQELIKWFNEK